MNEQPGFRGRRTLLATLAVGGFAPLALAQGGRHVTIIVPQPAGNPGDVFARRLQQQMQRELGQTVIVENQPGAGGAIGVQRMLNAPADGLTAVMVSQTEPILTPAALLSVATSPARCAPWACWAAPAMYSPVGPICPRKSTRSCWRWRARPTRRASR